MIVHAYDYVTGKISRIAIPPDSLCSIHFRRRLAVPPTVAIINIRSKSGIAGPGLLSAVSPGRVFLCDECLDTKGEAEQDAFADLVRKGTL